jgi:dephospho-CoA kinase
VTIAVTGPVACGKSTFVRMLGELGAETVSSDALVHDLLAGDRAAISAVSERFGDEVLLEGGKAGVDRRALAERVFGDPEALADLEAILHPLVREETDRRAAASEARLFVAEVPLLFEGGGHERFDRTVAVVAPLERRRAWAFARGMSEERFRATEARQLPQEEKARRADIVVRNDGDLDTLGRQARELMERLVGGLDLQDDPDGHEEG